MVIHQLLQLKVPVFNIFFYLQTQSAPEPSITIFKVTCDIFGDLPFFHLENHCDHWEHHCCTAGIKEVMYPQKSAGWTPGDQRGAWAGCWFTHRQKQSRATLNSASSNDGKCCHLPGWPARWGLFLFINFIVSTSLIVFSLTHARKTLQLEKKESCFFFSLECLLFPPVISALEAASFSALFGH